MAKNWSELPEDIIGLFVKRVACVVDFVAFSCVCKSWRSAAVKEKQGKGLKNFAPWLMLTKIENDHIDKQQKVIRLYSISKKKFFKRNLPQPRERRRCWGIRSFYSVSNNKLYNLELPEAQGTRCWGISYGWLLTVGLDSNIHLLNPLSRTQISLPSQTTLPELFPPPTDPRHMCCSFFDRFAVSSNPSFWTHESRPSSVVMVIYYLGFLAFATPGDEAWTPVAVKRTLPKSGNSQDIIVFNDRFYIITFNGVLRLCHVNGTDSYTEDIASPPPGPKRPNDTCIYYLLEMHGDLHLVARIRYLPDEPWDCYNYTTIKFEIFVFDSDQRKWIEVQEFDDYALFVGNNTSFSISISDYPEFKGNCIYFTDDQGDLAYETSHCDMGVYDFKMATFQPIYSGTGADYVFSKISRPVFFMPTITP